MQQAIILIIAFLLHGAESALLRAPAQATAGLDTQQAQQTVQTPRTEASADSSICNVTLPGYDDDRCFQQVLGRTKAQLHAELEGAEVLNSTVDLIGAKPGKKSQCQRLFYLSSFTDFEAHFTEFTQCHITTYAGIVQATAMKSPCRAATPDEAEVLMMPPYSAIECNWPAYGGGQCDVSANTYRYGPNKCQQEVVDVAKKLQAQYAGKRILMIDQNPWWEPYNLPASSYAIEGHIWAKVNSLSNFYRQHVDISMPPAAVDRCRHTPAKAYDEPVAQKKFFISFKGNLDNSPVRQSILRLYNNNNDQVIHHSWDSSYDFDHLLQASRFNLILRGDVEFSYRFNEAVCSGGVPVLVTDHWIPPFNELFPFESYGVFVLEKDIGSMLTTLKALSDQEVEKRRSKARTYCQSAFQTTEASVAALMNHITQSPR